MISIKNLTHLVDKDIETIGGFLINKFEKVPKTRDSESEGFLFTFSLLIQKKLIAYNLL